MTFVNFNQVPDNMYKIFILSEQVGVLTMYKELSKADPENQ